MADELFADTLLETEEAEVEQEETRAEALLRQLLDESREQNAALVRSVVAPRGQPIQQDELNPELSFSLEGLPDPQMDVAGFHKGYAARAAAAVAKMGQQIEQRASQRVTAAVSDREVLSRAEAMIKAANPDADQEIIAYAGGVVANRMKAQGKDPMAELRRDTEAVAQDIADHIDEMASKLGGRRAPAGAAEGRTRGMLAPRGRAPAAPKRDRDAPEDPKAFYKELVAAQMKARIY